ncbi:hypothetical protein ACXZ1K_05155 [Pedobacter sp. PWIIR3]
MITTTIFSSQYQDFALLASFVYVYFNLNHVRRFYRRAQRIIVANKRRSAITSTSPEALFEIALITYQNAYTIAYNMENQIVPWPHASMKASNSALPSDAYFVIRRELIVRGDLIERVTKEGKVFSVQLKAPFSCSYVIAKKRMAAFRNFGAVNNMPWWNRQRNRFR